MGIIEAEVVDVGPSSALNKPSVWPFNTKKKGSVYDHHNLDKIVCILKITSEVCLYRIGEKRLCLESCCEKRRGIFGYLFSSGH
jgi:hypothetical protein